MAAQSKSIRATMWAITGALLLFSTTSTVSVALQAKDSLREGFVDPPEIARPRVWWHWMNGNITKEGIKLDLEWMHRAGLGGFHIFEGSMFTPQVVEKRLAYMTPEWKDAFKYATTLADQFGFEEGIAGSPGWSETGGPWVPASEGMKKYVWSETRIEGGKAFTDTLAHPPSSTGAFQNLPVEDISALMGPPFTPPGFYRDSEVIAFKVPPGETVAEEIHAKVTSSGGTINASLLNDGDLVKTVSIPKALEGEKAWIQFEFTRTQTVRGITIVVFNKGPLDAFYPPQGDSGQALEASDDGQNYRVVTSIPKSGSTEHTISFEPVTARYFRVTFKSLPAPPNPFGDDPDAAAIFPKPSPNVLVSELVLHSGARVNHFEEKAAFIQTRDLYQFATPEFDPALAIKKNDVVDLTTRMHADGTLDWTPPAGHWVVLRFGYSLLGITNHPAAKESTGLEVDKLNAGSVKHYMDNYLDGYKETVGPTMMGSRGIRYVVTDSWEAGTQNWTEGMIAEFRKRRGYDPRPWLPVLAGHVVESAQASDKFLWDLRKTIADLTADAHYAQVEASLKERHMGHYGESHEGSRVFVADGMEVKKLDDIPMGAMWTQKPGVNKVQYGFNADDRESASVAHIYGQNLAAAESLTTCDSSTAWAWSPATLKPTVDQEFLNGINRIVIHESTHQPLIDKVPGLTLGTCGQWFNRNETWAEQAHVWIDYLARTSFLLQQGRFVADVIYFYGEDTNITAVFDQKSPNVPAGYDFDFINADGLIHELGTSRGRITTKSGMVYRLLALDPYSKHMSLAVLRAIHKMVEQGAVVAGEKPVDTPSLADDTAEFNELNDELFGAGTGVHFIGKGRVYAGQNAEAVLRALNVAPDFDSSKPANGQQIYFVHRKLADGDVYFVNNRDDKEADVVASFRVDGKAPELWYSETGTTAPASFKKEGSRTTVPLHLEPWGTVFVVFRKSTTDSSRTLHETNETNLLNIVGPWTIAFQKGRGAPPTVRMDKLTPWEQSSDQGVKYFSGTGIYTSTFQVAADWFQTGESLWVDLGDVKNIAVVKVNGKDVGTVWHAPYRVDVTAALKPGSNQLSISVVNAWVNRLIGDQQPDVSKKYTFSTSKSYRADSPLQPSGLIGPVMIVRRSGL